MSTSLKLKFALLARILMRASSAAAKGQGEQQQQGCAGLHILFDYSISHW